MLIFAKTLTGKAFPIEVDPMETIQNVKIKIGQKMNTPPVSPYMTLVYVANSEANRLDDGRKRVCDYKIKPDATVYVFIRCPGGGSAYDLISFCPECLKDKCNILKYCKDKIPLKNAAKYAWSALCDAFHISRETKEEIEINSESATVRFADVMHRLCHANPALTWSTIKTYIE